MESSDTPTGVRASSVCDRALSDGVRTLREDELVALVLGAGVRDPSAAAARLLDGAALDRLAWASPDELRTSGLSLRSALTVAAAFELGRRGAWSPPKRGERVLDPGRVYELMRRVAHAEREEFHTVLLDVRGRLMKTVKVAEGSLTQCPVSPRDALREPVRIGAHGVVFVHNHPSSGSPEPSAEDVELTERLRAASELVGVVARDHVIVATGGYFSFVEAGRWRR